MEDDHPVSHGTKVASIAMGQKLGVAKGATLVQVKTTLSLGEMLERSSRFTSIFLVTRRALENLNDTRKQSFW